MTASYRNIKNSASKNYVTYDLQEDLPLQSVAQGTMAFVKSVSSLYVYSDGWQPIKLTNEVPVLDGVPPATVSIPIGSNFSFDLSASDPDGLPITWSYEVVGGSLSINTVDLNQNTFGFNALDDTEFTIRFTASDSVNETTSDTVFTITNDPPSTPILLNGVSDTTAIYSDPTTVNDYQLSSVDPEGATPAFTATQISGDDINTSITNNTLSVIMDYDAIPATFDITASDGKYTSTNDITISPELQNFAFGFPTATATSGTDSTASLSYSGDVYKDRYVATTGYGKAKIFSIDEALGEMNLEATLDVPPAGDLPTGATGEYGGNADVKIYDDVLFISAPGNYFYEPTPATDPIVPGRVDIWTRTGTTWTYSSSIISPSGLVENDGFGITMSIDRINNVLAVAASGSKTVHIYNISGSTLTLDSTIDVDNIVSSDTGTPIGAFEDWNQLNSEWRLCGIKLDRNRLLLTDGANKLCILVRKDNSGVISWTAEPVLDRGVDINTLNEIRYKFGYIDSSTAQYDLENDTIVFVAGLNGLQMQVYELQQGTWTRVAYFPEGGEGTANNIQNGGRNPDNIHIRLKGSQIIMFWYALYISNSQYYRTHAKVVYRKNSSGQWQSLTPIVVTSTSGGSPTLISSIAVSHNKVINLWQTASGFSVTQYFDYYQSTN